MTKMCVIAVPQGSKFLFSITNFSLYWTPFGPKIVSVLRSHCTFVYECYQLCFCFLWACVYVCVCICCTCVYMCCTCVYMCCTCVYMFVSIQSVQLSHLPSPSIPLRSTLQSPRQWLVPASGQSQFHWGYFQHCRCEFSIQSWYVRMWCM